MARIIIAQWVSKAVARKIRRQYMLDNAEPQKIAYIAKVDFGQPGGRTPWIVFGDK